MSAINETVIVAVVGALSAAVGGYFSYLASKRKNTTDAASVITDAARDLLGPYQAETEKLRTRVLDLEKQLADANQRVNNLDNGLRRLATASELETTKLRAENDALRDQLQAVHKENDNLKLEIGDLTKKVGRLGGRPLSNAQASELALLRSEVEQLRHDAEVLRDENEELKAQLNGVAEKISRYGTGPLKKTI